MSGLSGLRIAHPDGTSTPVDVTFVGTEPREVNGEIYIIDIWETTSIVVWNAGDRWEADEEPDYFAIRSHRVGTR
ncbi:MAG: hypothetical protein WBB07_17555 [Mycobacterium sp.]